MKAHDKVLFTKFIIANNNVYKLAYRNDKPYFGVWKQQPDGFIVEEIYKWNVIFFINGQRKEYSKYMKILNTKIINKNDMLNLFLENREVANVLKKYINTK